MDFASHHSSSTPKKDTEPEMLRTPVPGYQKKLQVYDRFREHLHNLGFTLYPEEFFCPFSTHPLVDIAAKMGAFYWGFEYKSEGDNISIGVKQVKCYREWFDYVVLVSEKDLDHRLSENYWKLRNIGAGIWVYDPTQDKRIVKASPSIQTSERRGYVSRRFAAAQRGRNSSNALIEVDIRNFMA
jgi:hypothetical protein